MIIKEITIENFLCYYDIKKFELSDKLNIILGENGEGKTKFFEAIEWLFNGENRNLDALVSKKKLSETEIDNSFKVEVRIHFVQYNQNKYISRSFDVTKRENQACSTSNFKIEGIEENNVGERELVNGKNLLDQIFPTSIRKYSMFKGESELNIFNNEDALTNLINTFSEAKYYDKYAEKGSLLRLYAEKQVEASDKGDKIKEKAYKNIQIEIERLKRDLYSKTTLLNNSYEQLKKTEANIQGVENHVNNAEALETVNKRIQIIDEDIKKAESRIHENYTTQLFDENWFLMHFEDIHAEYQRKIAALSTEKRNLQTEFDREEGIKEGEQRVKTALLNNVIPLPVGTPSRPFMEEMLKDEVCKVCNRDAKKGTDAYEFMLQRLNEYLNTQTPTKTQENSKSILYKNNYIQRLVSTGTNQDDNLSKLRNVKQEITDLFAFNTDRKNEVAKLNEKRDKEIAERENIVGNSTEGADKLHNVFKNYNSWQKDKENLSKDISNYEKDKEKLERDINVQNDEKAKIDVKSVSSYLINSMNILKDIELIFRETKEQKFDEFINLIQTNSNLYFNKINKDAFTGYIKFLKKKKGEKIEVELELMQNDTIFHKPGTALLTSMHISVLFAISQLAKEKRDESYPLIFDAPTSSFGETKRRLFLELLNETEGQIILLTKDFLDTKKDKNEIFVKDEFQNIKRNKSFWIKLERPFDQNNLKTINTLVEEI